MSNEPGLLHAIFDRVAAAHPERIAVEVPPSAHRASRAVMTYGALAREAAALAARLAPLVASVGPDSVVAILLARESCGLYAAQLGVLRAGAAFTCLDPAFPDAHLRAVLAEAGAVAFVSDARGVARVRGLGVPSGELIDIEAAACGGAAAPPARVTPASLAYVIYTSGTTGTPKGVMIEHRSLAHLVCTDVERFGLGPADRVAQMSSPAYDSSLEETWLAFAVGATLVPLDDETVRLGPDLVPWLRRERITVFCPPPTLLRTLACRDPEKELPGVRLLYVGGEALTQDLADAWAPGRRLENGYGPTECTVTVVRGRVHAGRPVTIGTPVEGHRAWVLDESLREVADGEAGELCIAGPGLARGYRGRPDLTAERFLEHPVFGRIYRTGDLVRRDAAGELVYLGRIDGQVKLRGYRVELPAIEAALARCPGVREAACTVQGDAGDQTLAAHLVPNDGAAPPSIEELQRRLRAELPAYMVPAMFAFTAALPRTIGGKLDRRALPRIAAPAAARAIAPPRNDLERVVVEAFARATHAAAVSMHDDFFLDLGGDSLRAVGAVCALREDPRTAHATVRDIYAVRTAARLTERLAAAPADFPPAPAAPPARARAAHPVCTALGQVSWIAGGCALVSGASYALVFLLLPGVTERIGVVPSLVLAPFATFLGLALYTLLAVASAVAVKLILIGRYEPCRVPVGSGAFLRHWIVQHTARLIPWGLIEGTVIVGAVLRALGARVGARVHIHRGVDLWTGGWDLLSIGDEATLAQEAAVRLVELDDGQLVVGPISIGDGAVVDVRAGLSPHSAIERNGALAPLSWLAPGTRIPEGERWDGVPARYAGKAPDAPDVDRGSDLGPAAHCVLMLACRFARHVAWSLPFLAVALVVTWRYAADARDAIAWCSSLPLLPLAALSFAAVPLALAAQALGLRLLGRVRPGVIPRFSFEAIIVWTKTGALDSACRWLSGSLFWPWWLRLAGMRIGKGCEISTIIDVLPETVTIDAESFFADGIYFCPPRVCRGTITIAETRVGRNTFLGNHAFVPAGHAWPEDFFVGVSTPADPERARPGTDWFGHPAMELPRREVVAADRRLTHEPGLVRFLTRLFWETLRFALPAWPLCVCWWWFDWIAAARAAGASAAAMCAIVPVATLAAMVVLCATIVVLKWGLLGRVKPGRHAFWSCWCGRWDFLYVAWSFYARGLLARIEGTVLLQWFLRAVGVKIGKGVVLGGGFAQVVDPDMLTFEDDATVACQFQAHSFEDRILKIDRLVVRRGATAGNHAVIFFGADIGAGARVDPHGVVMKGERLAPGVRYAGCPTAPATQS